MYIDFVDLSFVVKWSLEDKGYYFFGIYKLFIFVEIVMEVFEVVSFIDLFVFI